MTTGLHRGAFNVQLRVGFAPKRFVVLGLLLCYVCLIFCAYFFLVSPRYAYEGFVFDPLWPNLWLSGLLALLPATWLSVAATRPSQVILWFLYVLVLVPALLLPPMLGALSADSCAFYALLLFVNFALLSVVPNFPRLAIPKLRTSWPSFWAFFLLCATLGVFVVVSTYGFRLQFVSFASVYSLRSDYTESLNTSGFGRFIAYAVGWLANVMYPFLVAFGLRKRQYVLVILGFLGQLMIYSITGFKSVFFASFLVAGLWLVLRRQGKNFAVLVLLGLIGLMTTAWVMDAVLGFQFATAVVMHRLIMMPGVLTSHYFEYFATHPVANLGHSIFSGFVDYPYDFSPARQIGWVYYNNLATEANAHVWADAFSNFGVWGLWVFTVLTMLLFWVLDSVAQNIDFVLACTLFGTVAFNLVNTGLLTSILNHGIGFAIVLMWLLPRTPNRFGEKHA